MEVIQPELMTDKQLNLLLAIGRRVSVKFQFLKREDLILALSKAYGQDITKLAKNKVCYAVNWLRKRERYIHHHIYRMPTADEFCDQLSEDHK